MALAQTPAGKITWGNGAPSSARIPQFNIRSNADLIARIRALCRAERRTFADVLRVLLDAYEARALGVEPDRRTDPFTPGRRMIACPPVSSHFWPRHDLAESCNNQSISLRDWSESERVFGQAT